ncbi:MAG: preprotein translocase subunit SecE [Patescibacteria group bacterium]|nr:preprotein translocase subunit SecE [Patescibacteria group bacterium]
MEKQETTKKKLPKISIKVPKIKVPGIKMPAFLRKFFEYLKESKDELKKVTWPTRKEAIHYTVVVLVISTIIAVFLGLFDFLLSKGITFLIK